MALELDLTTFLVMKNEDVLFFVMNEHKLGKTSQNVEPEAVSVSPAHAVQSADEEILAELVFISQEGTLL